MEDLRVIDRGVWDSPAWDETKLYDQRTKNKNNTDWSSVLNVITISFNLKMLGAIAKQKFQQHKLHELFKLIKDSS